MTITTNEFLRLTLGNEGYVCITGINHEGYVKQEFFETLEDAIQTAHKFDNEGRNAFFALARFSTDDSRRADNVKELRAFFLDLDCGPSKEYANQSEALVDLRRFCKELNLPKPTTVNSGYGVHAYWHLTEPVSRAEWQPIAYKFKALTERYNLRGSDPAIPADSARVLRVPGTHNHKRGTPVPVEIIGDYLVKPMSLEQFNTLLGDDTAIPVPAVWQKRERDPMTDLLAGNYVSRFKTILTKTMKGEGCSQLKIAIEEQENAPEPLWRAALSIAAHCWDRDKAIHKISAFHPEYDPEDTERKANQIKGPYTCAKFDAMNPGVCAGCPSYGKVKSPIVLGKELAEATEEDYVVQEPAVDLPNAPIHTYVIPKYPAPYTRGKNGGIYVREEVEDDQGNTQFTDKLVYHNDLYVVSRLNDPDIGESLVLRLHLPKDGVREFTMPLHAVGSREEFRKTMATYGVAVLKPEPLMQYINKWVNELQLQSAADEARRQFGWTDDKFSSFILGKMEITKDEIRTNPASSATIGMMSAFEPKGSLDRWKDLMEMYNRPGLEAHQYVIGSGFGSILMEMMPINGVALHLHSDDSGHGKTTALFSAASIWGDPDKLVLQKEDTHNSKMNRAEVYKNLPFLLDEMTNTAPKDLSDFAYQLPNGRQRNRMSGKANTERHRGEPWKFLCVSTGNSSMIEKIASFKAAPKAEAQRILEYRMPNRLKMFDSKEETDTFSLEVKKTYGHAGVIFVQYVMNNLEAVRDLVFGIQRRIDQKAGLTQQNRFWSVHAACSIAGLTIARHLKLVNYEIKGVVNFIVDVIEQNKSGVSSMGGDVEEILTDYIAENYNNILRIVSTADNRRNEIDTGLDHLVQPDATPRLTLVGRYEYDIKRLYLLPKPLKAWCVKQQLNYVGFVEGLKNGRTKLQRDKFRLSKGTRATLPPANVLVIDCSGFMDDEVEKTLGQT